jgi:hypothetical protein
MHAVSMGDRAVKNLLIDGAIKFILLLIVAAGHLTSPSNAAVDSNHEPSRTPDLSQHHSTNLPLSEN